ncbi:MAG: nucleotidyltransferase domain-containing protein [Nanoarchaeota archaeon]|nr:nucleotidyltransferase domain-containing protein [Nanoarchaeota archaeon]MBU1103823.1 nucleotidyltransferase domain-containing protein [Nanoarchaeota archaeon]
MNAKRVLETLDFSVGKNEFNELEKETKSFLNLLKKQVSKKKVNCEVFLGGSFAKGTLAKSESYDADIFVRFGRKCGDLSDYLGKILKNLVKRTGMKIERLHGSRDYFRIRKNEKLIFELIPVLKIKKIVEAMNVMDLSYFHVNYVRRNLKGRLRKEVSFAKKFCEAQGVYGAESYINGFSGYGLECLIIHFKSFEKMLKELIKIKDKKLVIDTKKFYKKKGDVFIELNESKLQSPIILIDPTWKERNVLASLNWETFVKFQSAARNFLKKPSEKFFYKKEINVSQLKKKNGEFLHLVLETDKQEGDIAGTKLRKFSNFLIREIEKYFYVLGKEFVYRGEGKKAELYLTLKSRGEVLKKGPPVTMKKDAVCFRKKNEKTAVRGGVLYCKVKTDFSGKEFLKKFVRKNEKKIKEMGVVDVRIE